MPYPKTTWVNDSTPALSAANLNKMEAGIEAAHVAADGLAAVERRGTGSPEGVVSAAPGTYYTDTSGTTGAWRWLKTTGTGATGWAVVLGDTGWRDMQGAILWGNGWTAVSTFQLRRINNQVFWNVWGLSRDASASGAIPVADLMPVGFRPPISVYGVIPTSAYTRFYVSTAGAFVMISPPTLSFCAESFVTNQAWPTTLPGTAA